MKVTGLQLQFAIRETRETIKLLAGEFSDSLHAFPDEDKTTPVEVMAAFDAAERRLCALQTAQGRYNLAQTVSVQGERMTLSEAIKRVGGAGRAEGMWKSACTGAKRDRYSYRDNLTRSTDEVRARRTISNKDAVAAARKAGRYHTALRNAITVANTKEIEIEGLDPVWFE